MTGSGPAHERAERLYEQARALPPAERAAFLDSACRGAAGLRAELNELLAHADDAEAFFARLSHLVTTATAGGDVVAGRYEIRACIGVGGMGAVYRAHDVRLQRDVALKFLPPHLTAEPDAHERLLREARAAAALEHSNICTIHEIGEDETGRPFISMALYEGETLKQRLRRGALPAAEAVDIARQLARGLAAAHAHGIVHRDVKPGNVMLTRDGAVKLLDFGLARVDDATLTQPGVTPGTVAYMSPEQARGDAIDARSDLFSLGVVLYEMIAGVHPFRGGNPHAVIQAIQHNPVEPLRTHVPDAPDGLERIVTRLLAKKPESRYESANQLAADLEQSARWAGHTRGRAAHRRRMWLPAALLAVVVASWLAFRVQGGERGAVSADATGAAGEATSPMKTIAVLPFTNMSRDPSQDYLVDGLTEELIGALSKVRALRVVARTSAFAFKGQNRDIREIGRALDVDAILEGSVQTAGDRIRVRAQLISVHDGLHLWSETYDREVADMFTVQRDLALLIGDALRTELSPSERARVTRRPTTSAEAFAHYLRGRHFWNQRTSESFLRAREHFERAIATDSQFAAAYAGLAAVYSLQGIWSDIPPAEARTRTREAALKAVELDEDLAEAHSVLGAYLHVYEWDSEAAERAQLRAIELNPAYVTAHFFYGNLLRSHGRFDAALARYRIAAEQDPLDPSLKEMMSRTLLLAGRIEEAGTEAFGAVELDSMFWRAHASVGLYYESVGRWNDALVAYQRAQQLGGGVRAEITRVLAFAGRAQEARQRLAELVKDASRTRLHDPQVATAMLALGDREAALDWLERSYRDRHPQLRFIAGHPSFRPLEKEPRYIDLLRRIRVRR